MRMKVLALGAALCLLCACTNQAEPTRSPSSAPTPPQSASAPAPSVGPASPSAAPAVESAAPSVASASPSAAPAVESAAPSVEPSPAPESAEPSPTPAVSAPTAEDARAYIGKDVSQLLAALGEPTGGSSYASSCLGDGEDGELLYDGFTVYTYRENGVETVQDVE